MTRFERMTPDGTGTLEDWGTFPPEELEAGAPRQSGKLWLDDTANGVIAGVWACTPMTGKMGPWSTNEFMVLLEGAVSIEHASGEALHVTAGESFLIPKGTVCAWKQPGDVRKFFVIHNDTSGLEPRDPNALRAFKVDTLAALVPCDGPDPKLVIGSAPQWHDRGVFENLSHQMTVGVWSTTPYARREIDFPRHELMHFLEGSVTLTDGAGRAETFNAGDTVFVPKGARIGWKNDVPVKKVYCIFLPKAVAAARTEAAE